MRRSAGPQARFLAAAALAPARYGAARMEGAAGRQARRRRRLSRDRFEPRRDALELRQAAQQRERVGMARPGEDRPDRPGLDNAPPIHHRHAMRHFGDHAEIMRDQDHRGSRLGLAAGEQRQHLRLHRDIERGGRLVGDDEAGSPRHRHRDHRALAHPARELVRVLDHPPGRVGDVDLAQEVDRARACLVRAQPAMRDLVLGQLPADGEDRIERRRQVLEHHADIDTAHAPERLMLGRGNLHAAQADRAAYARGRRQQSRDREQGDALARAGLADDPEHFVGVRVEIDAPDSRHRPARADKGNLERADGEDRLSHPRAHPCGIPSRFSAGTPACARRACCRCRA